MLLRNKILSGFGSGAIICLMVGLVAVIMCGISNKASEKAREMTEIEKNLMSAHRAHIEWKLELQSGFFNNDEKLDVEVDGHKCGFGAWYYGGGLDDLKTYDPEAAEILKTIENTHLELHNTAEKINEVWKPVHPGLTEKLQTILSAHRAWAINVANAVLENKKAEVETDPGKCMFGQFLSGQENRDLENKWPEYAALIQKIKVHHNNLHESVDDINRAGSQVNKRNIFINTTEKELAEIEKLFNQIISLEEFIVKNNNDAVKIFKTETVPLIETVSDTLVKTSGKIRETGGELQVFAAKTTKNQYIIIMTGVAAGIILAVFLGFLITASIMKQLGADPSTIKDIAEKIAKGDLRIELDEKNPVGVYKSIKAMVENLKSIISNIASSADQVNSGSEQISESSQQISSGANEQAAGTEEVSSSMEELASNIQLNSENAQKSNNIAKSVVVKAEEGGKAVKETVEAMKNISEKISIIEDIARNTNMLALNAAIEAARAGEAGKGFSVVAAEVRKLAENSQKAAGDIITISSSSLARADEALHVIEDLIPEFREVSELVQDITSASNEQNTGAEQINKAILQLDTVIQQNASYSEEMASMAEELSSQAEIMHNTIGFFKTGSSSYSVVENKDYMKKGTGPARNKGRAVIKSENIKTYQNGKDRISPVETADDVFVETIDDADESLLYKDNTGFREF